MAYAIPFVPKSNVLQRETLWNKIGFIIASEFKHRLYQVLERILHIVLQTVH